MTAATLEVLPPAAYSVRTAETLAAFRAGKDRSVAALRELITGRLTEVLEALHRHGAVLFRGFDLTRAEDLEAALAGTPWQPWEGWWFVEAGRERVAPHVLTSNYTRSYFMPFGAHSENCMSPLSEVPEWVAFCCLQAPEIGGETFVVHMANAYAELPAGLRTRLEEFPCRRLLTLHRSQWEEVAGTTQEEELKASCAQHGAPVDAVEGDVAMLRVERPYVMRHPGTGRPSLHAMLLEWEDPPLPFMKLWRFRYPLRQWLRARWKARQLRQSYRGFQQMMRSRGWSLALTRREVRELGAAVARHTTAVHYEIGDMLLVDNFQMLHGAAPWRGQRKVLSMMGRREAFVPD